MPNAQRVGDSNSAGGAITGTPQGSVYINGVLASVNGSSVSPHPPCPDSPAHCSAKTSNGASTVFINGIPVNYAGNSDTCGHPRVAGSPDTFVEG